LIRWLTVVVGVGVAAAALHALLSTPAAPPARRATPPAVAAPAAGDPHGEIDERSRARLERVLRDAEAGDEVRR
jgi:hypothetical protein